jgi:hypothetical protein
VKQDYESYKNFVKSGGIIGFHDINENYGVRSFWNEIKKERFMEIYEEEGHMGIGLIRKE